MDLKINDINNMNSRNFFWLNFQENLDYLIRVIWFFIVFVFGILGNFLLFVVFFRRGRIIYVVNLFNFNLVIVDLIWIFVFILIYLVYFLYDEWLYGLGLVGCRSVYIVVEFIMIVFIYMFFFMSMERYKVVVYFLKKLVRIRFGVYDLFLMVVILYKCLLFF